MNKTSKFLMSITLASAAFATSSSVLHTDTVSAATITHNDNVSAEAKPGTNLSANPITNSSTNPSTNPYEVAGISNAKAFHTFFITFQQAVIKDNKAKVASMVHYPFNVNTNGKTHKIKNARSFIAKYDSIMTPEVKRTLAYALEEDLFVNWQGVMVGSGELWFGESNNKLGLIAVNP